MTKYGDEGRAQEIRKIVEKTREKEDTVVAIVLVIKIKPDLCLLSL